MAPYSQNNRRARKRIIVATFAALLMVLIGGAGGIEDSRNHDADLAGMRFRSRTESSSSSRTLKAFCSVTLYPDVCMSWVSSSAGYSATLGIRETAALIADVAVDRTYAACAALDELAAGAHVAHHMHTMLALTRKAATLVHEFHVADIADPTGDVQTWLSAALACLETFMDRLSSNDVKAGIVNTAVAAKQMVSNSLAVANKLWAVLELLGVKAVSPHKRRILGHGGFPNWVSAGARKLLQADSSQIEPDVVVALDGSGHYTSIQAAVDNIPRNSFSRYIIFVKKGTYREQVSVPQLSRPLMIMGEGMDSTIISFNRNVADGSATFDTATFATMADGFMARDIAFINSAGPAKQQAVALRCGADKSVFYRCKVQGYQDTLYAHSQRQFYTQCVIIGTVDFIFGDAVSFFQNCSIIVTKPMLGQPCTVTAQGRSDPNSNTGIVIHRSTVTATDALQRAKMSTPVYLGRPWKQYSRTVFMLTYIGDIIRPEGWLAWNGAYGLKTLEYREFKNSGPGSVTSKRVNWPGLKILSNPREARQYTLARFIPESLPESVHVPYIAGL